MTDKKEQIARFIQREFPQTRVVVEAVGGRGATVWQAVDAGDLRPGGTGSAHCKPASLMARKTTSRPT